MLSFTCGEEAGTLDKAERDRQEFEAFYDTVKMNKSLKVCVWRKQASSPLYIPKVETIMFSQRFLEANAIIIQTFWRLWRKGVPRERRDQCHGFFFHKGQTVS